ncbi:MAG: isoleucine--tRNA ligase [Pirellulales bacterium]|nr:isoleucine--tRNA ligase [Pirellulales bacterium]
MFQAVESSISFPKLEEKIIQFWKERAIYEKSLCAREGSKPFIFYEGPPTANGLPHPGHCLTRAIKDLFPRYKTMRGYLCERKAGWDTHGLPVEVEVCKELGIHSKEEIESYGIEPFIRKCIESVFRYTQQWEHLTERLGFWIHLDEAYVTFHQSYVESVWWALKNLFDRGLLYRGHKIVWWWAQGGTALSSGEVGQGYREVADPSVYVKFPLLNDDGKAEGPSLLVWTTTPWTLPSNQFVAVHPDLEYSLIIAGDEDAIYGHFWMASALVDQLAAKVKLKFELEAKCSGKDLIGKRYGAPFYYYDSKLGDKQGHLKTGEMQHIAWRVVAADFVTVDTGTGIVHQAPAFGEVDFDLLQTEQARFVDGEGPTLICSVAPDGTFTADAPDYKGRWVKEADRDIIRDLKKRGLLFHQEQFQHDYPFCWRAEEDPLIQYPRKSWFIRTTAFKKKMLANNSRINWLPEHIKEGRFGNFLETNVDWALSRERYWGTPLPIWICEKTGYAEAVANYAELLQMPGLQGTEVWEQAKKKDPALPDDLKIHKPYIDAVTYDSPKAAGARMRRVTEVIDCWFDSGAMPFAQWGYPHQNGSSEKFREQFPADFISEAIDQTRGWFYSMLAISTLLFGENDPNDATTTEPGTTRLADSPLSTLPSPLFSPHPSPLSPHPSFPHPFRNCIVLGLMLGEDGQKMSKSKRNYREPNDIFDRYGADALRWFFYANQPPWTSIRYSEQSIKDCIPEFLLRLWNVYSFFVIYASIDKFDPAAEIAPSTPLTQLDAKVLAAAKSYRPVGERSELDRWILSELNRTAAAVVARMDEYDNYGACAKLTEFVDALSNWYVRRSRDRFWSGGESAEKSDAYWTLYECLLTACKLIAPFTPFLAEEMWQNLAVAAFESSAPSRKSLPAESVHLCDFPTGDSSVVDAALSERMALAREIVSLGRSARMGAKLKVRQPLKQVEVVMVENAHQAWLEEHAALICDELNVKRIEFTAKADRYITYSVLPDLKRLGPRLGKKLPAVKKLLAEADGGRLLAELESTGRVALDLPDGPVALDKDDIQVRLQAKEGWAAAQGKCCVVVLSTELTPELIAEGVVREEIRVIQDIRKEDKLQFTDRIEVAIISPSAILKSCNTTEGYTEIIRRETLSVALHTENLFPNVRIRDVLIGEHPAQLQVKVVEPSNKENETRPPLER